MAGETEKMVSNYWSPAIIFIPDTEIKTAYNDVLIPNYII